MLTPGKAKFLSRALPLAVIGTALLSMAPTTITVSSRLILSGDALKVAGADLVNIDDYSAGLNLPAKAGEVPTGLPLLVSKRLDRESTALLTSALTAAAAPLSVSAVNFDSEQTELLTARARLSSYSVELQDIRATSPRFNEKLSFALKEVGFAERPLGGLKTLIATDKKNRTPGNLVLVSDAFKDVSKVAGGISVSGFTLTFDTGAEGTPMAALRAQPLVLRRIPDEASAALASLATKGVPVPQMNLVALSLTLADTLVEWRLFNVRITQFRQQRTATGSSEQLSLVFDRLEFRQDDKVITLAFQP